MQVIKQLFNNLGKMSTFKQQILSAASKKGQRVDFWFTIEVYNQNSIMVFCAYAVGFDRERKEYAYT